MGSVRGGKEVLTVCGGRGVPLVRQGSERIVGNTERGLKEVTGPCVVPNVDPLRGIGVVEGAQDPPVWQSQSEVPCHKVVVHFILVDLWSCLGPRVDPHRDILAWVDLVERNRRLNGAGVPKEALIKHREDVAVHHHSVAEIGVGQRSLKGKDRFVLQLGGALDAFAVEGELVRGGVRVAPHDHERCASKVVAIVTSETKGRNLRQYVRDGSSGMAPTHAQC